MVDSPGELWIAMLMLALSFAACLLCGVLVSRFPPGACWPDDE